MGDDTKKNFHKLLFGVRRSIRYHNRRRLFFDRLNKFATFFSALAGTATVASVLAKLGQSWTLGFALAVAVLSAVDLVVGTAKSARLHNDLSKRFIDLEKTINETGPKTDEALINLINMRLDIEKDEPPPLKILDSMCHNELLRALGYDSSNFVKIKWYQRLFSNFFDINEHTVRKG